MDNKADKYIAKEMKGKRTFTAWLKLLEARRKRAGNKLSHEINPKPEVKD